MGRLLVCGSDQFQHSEETARCAESTGTPPRHVTLHSRDQRDNRREPSLLQETIPTQTNY